MWFLGTLSCDQIEIFAQTLFLLTMLAEFYKDKNLTRGDHISQNIFRNSISYWLDPIFKAEDT